MRSNYLLPAALAVVVVLVMGIIVFLPSSIDDRQGTSPNGTQAQVTPGNDTTQLNGNNGSASASDKDRTENGVNGPTPSGNVPSGQTIASSTGANGQSSSLDAGQTNQSDIVPAPGAIHGIVEDTHGIPVRKAAVSVQGDDPTYSDVQGRFSITEIKVPSVTLIATLAGYQTLVQANVTVGETRLVLTMVKEGVLAGRVLDQYSAPVSFAKVHLKALKGIWMTDLSADPQGRFEIASVPQVQIQIAASQEGYLDEGKGTVEVTPPVGKEIVLHLKQPAFSIEGNVTMKDTGQGVAGFKLRAVRQDSGSDGDQYEAVTSGNGMYKFPSVRRGTYLVSSIPTENSALNIVIPVRDDFKTVRIFEKGATNVNFEAVAGLTVGGVVLNSQSQPVRAADVTIAGFESTHAFSGSDGRFRLTGVPVLTAEGRTSTQDASIRLLATHSEEGTGMSDPLPTGTGGELADVTIILKGIGNLSGSVVDRSGAAVPDARVVLRDLIQNQVQETTTDGAGSFFFESVTSAAQSLVQFQGTHEIEAIKEGYATGRQRIVFSPGQEQSVTITLESGGIIQGRIRDSSGQLMGGVNVTVYLPSGGVVTAIGDPTGEYQLTGLPDGVYDLHFRLETNPPMTGELYRIPVGSTNADVELIPGEFLTMGTVIDIETRQIITHYYVTIVGTPKNRKGAPFLLYRDVNTHDGTYQLTFTELGEYRIRITAPGYTPYDGKVEISLNVKRVQYINYELESTNSTGGIRGVFVPQPGMTLTGLNVLGVQSYPVAGNEFVLENIPAGEYDLVFLVREESENGVGNSRGSLSVRVQANGMTDLGPITPVKLRVNVREL